MKRIIFHVDVKSAFLSWEACYRIHHHCSTPFTSMLPNQLGRGLTICVEMVFRKTRN